MPATKQWDCRYASSGKNLVNGIIELADAIDLTADLPAGLRNTLSALFGYRTKIFHLGFEWSVSQRATFDARPSVPAVSATSIRPSWVASETAFAPCWLTSGYHVRDQTSAVPANKSTKARQHIFDRCQAMIHKSVAEIEDPRLAADRFPPGTGQLRRA